MIKVFLGGTCQGYDWRKVLEDRFDYVKFLELYNPIVKNWTEDCVNAENEYKKNCDFCLFVITPYMEGIYSIAEAVDMSNKSPERTVFVYIDNIVEGREKRYFTKKMLHSLEVTSELIKSNGGVVLTSLDEVIDYIRNYINK